MAHLPIAGGSRGAAGCVDGGPQRRLGRRRHRAWRGQKRANAQAGEGGLRVASLICHVMLLVRIALGTLVRCGSSVCSSHGVRCRCLHRAHTWAPPRVTWTRLRRRGLPTACAARLLGAGDPAADERFAQASAVAGAETDRESMAAFDGGGCGPIAGREAPNCGRSSGPRAAAQSKAAAMAARGRLAQTSRTRRSRSAGPLPAPSGGAPPVSVG